MSSVDHREKTAPRRRAGERSTPFVFRTVLRNAPFALQTFPPTNAIFNSFKMILLHSDKNNVPGMILLQDNDGRSPHPNGVSLPNSRRICALTEKSHQEKVGAKSLRMISLQNHRNKQPGMILLQKRVGVPPPGALSLPSFAANVSAKSQVDATSMSLVAQGAPFSGGPGGDSLSLPFAANVTTKVKMRTNQHTAGRTTNLTLSHELCYIPSQPRPQPIFHIEEERISCEQGSW